MTTNSNLAGYTQITNASPLYINGAIISNNATTPNTKLNVSSGIMRDQSGMLDIAIGDYLNTDTSTVINTAVVGMNGIDVGVLQASKVYYVYVVADTSGANPTGAMVSLSAPATGPVMPYNYDAYRHIGYIHTDSSVHFIAANWIGSSNKRKMAYYAPVQSAISAGNDTTYTAFSLAPLVPTIQTVATFYVSLTPSAASRVANLAPFGGANPQLTVSGQVTSVGIAGQGEVTVLVDSSLPKIAYEVTNSSDAVSIKVVSYEFTV